MDKAPEPLRGVIDSGLRAEADSAAASWGLRLEPRQWSQLEAYVADLLSYRQANVTAAKTARELLLRHALDGIAAAAALRSRLGANPELLDAGAGGGFVGICLKIAWPEARVTLAEATYRKCCFLNWTLARMGLEARVLQRRLEGLDRGAYDAVLARALAPLGEALSLCAPLCARGGLLGIFQSGGESADFTPPIGLTEEPSFVYRLPGEPKDRRLAFFRTST